MSETTAKISLLNVAWLINEFSKGHFKGRPTAVKHALDILRRVADVTPSGLYRDQGACAKCGSVDWHDWPQGPGKPRVKCSGCGVARFPTAPHPEQPGLEEQLTAARALLADAGEVLRAVTVPHAYIVTNTVLEPSGESTIGLEVPKSIYNKAAALAARIRDFSADANAEGKTSAVSLRSSNGKEGG